MRADAKGGVAPAVTVHGLAHALVALGAAGPRGVLLLSAPDAAARAGALWFLEVVRQARAAHPGVPCRAALDCGAAPGLALAAIRAGVEAVILDPAVPAFAAVASAAAEAGVALWPERPAALDLAGYDPRRRDDMARLRAWLSATGTP
ncbi:MAG TPA: hypothetical protein VD970_10700 [Acetobacteraceae bacterium]|nr:hypothetical protein [Acetobacteraceae bacterium]